MLFYRGSARELLVQLLTIDKPDVETLQSSLNPTTLYARNYSLKDWVLRVEPSVILSTPLSLLLPQNHLAKELVRFVKEVMEAGGIRIKG